MIFLMTYEKTETGLFQDKVWDSNYAFYKASTNLKTHKAMKYQMTESDTVSILSFFCIAERNSIILMHVSEGRNNERIAASAGIKRGAASSD